MASALAGEKQIDITSSELKEIGGRIRSLRLQHAWTLDTLASRAGLSKSYISRLEDGDRQASIAALISLSGALGISLGDLMVDQTQPSDVRVVRGADAITTQGNGLIYQTHSGAIPNAAMQPIRITIPSGRVGKELYRHDGEEWLYVLSGTLILTLDETNHELNAGDSVYFDATVGHRLMAQGDRDVEAILVASISNRSLLSSYR